MKEKENEKEYVVAKKVTEGDFGIDEKQIKRPESIRKIFENIEMYSGNLLPCDLFIINGQPQFEKCLYQINEISHDKNLGIYYPFVRNLGQATPYIKSQGCFFNMYLDIENAEKLSQLIKSEELSQIIYSNINEIHVYNLSPTSVYQRFHQLKTQEPKVKSLHNCLEQELYKILHSLEYRAKFQKAEEIVTKLSFSYRNYLNSFAPLDDASFNSTYRSIILAHVRILRENQLPSFRTTSDQIKQSKKNFKEYIQRLKKFIPQNQQTKILTKWDMLDHYLQIDRQQQGYLQQQQNQIKIMCFYKAESFYYNVLNTMLKICQTPSEYKHIALPAAETSVVIKDFYDKHIIEKDADASGNLIRSALKLYRGTREMIHIKNNTANSIFKQGQVYENLACMSFSKNQNSAQKFIKATDPDGCVYIVEIPRRVFRKDQLENDNGFFDFAHYQIKNFFSSFMSQIGSSTFKSEDEVVFKQGCLFKFKELDIKSYDFPALIFTYTTIDELEQELEHQRQKFGNQQVSQSFKRKQKIVSRYRSYKMQQLSVQDKGDCLRMAEQFEDERKYYIKRSADDNSTNIKIKLLDAQIRYGTDLRKIQCQLKTLLQQSFHDILEHKSLKVKVKTILKQLQKLSEYESFLDKQIAHLEKDKKNNYFQIAEALNEKGEIYQLESKLPFAKSVLNKAIKILNNKVSSLLKKRSQLQGGQEVQQQSTSCCACFWQKISASHQQNHQTLSENQKTQILKQIRDELLKNMDLGIKVSQNLLKCYDNMDAEFRNKQKTRLYLESLYTECRTRINQYIQELGGSDKLMTEQKLFKLKIQLLLQALDKNNQLPLSSSAQAKIYQREIQKQIAEEEKRNPYSEKVASLTYSLASAQNQYLSSALKDPQNSQFVTATIDQSKIDIKLEEDAKKIPKTSNQKYLDQQQVKKSKQAYGNTMKIDQSKIDIKLEEDAKKILKTSNQKYLDQQQVKKSKQAYVNTMKKSIKISLTHKPPHHPVILSKRLVLSEHFYEHHQVKQVDEQAKQIIESPIADSTLCGVKGYLLLGKNYCNKGELIQARAQFKKAEQKLSSLTVLQKPSMNSFQIFNRLVGSRHNRNHITSYPLYFDIKIQAASLDRKIENQKGKAKIFKQLVFLKDQAEEFLDECQKSRYLSKIFEEMALIKATLPDPIFGVSCFDFFLVENNYMDLFHQCERYMLERGKYDIEVGTFYCTIAKTILSSGIYDSEEIKLVESYLDKAMQIFSRFPVNHPLNWFPIVSVFELSVLKHNLRKKQKKKKGKTPPNIRLQQSSSQIKILQDSLVDTESFQDESRILNYIKYAVYLIKNKYPSQHINYLNVNLMCAMYLFETKNPQTPNLVNQLKYILNKNNFLSQLTQTQIKKSDQITQQDLGLLKGDQKAIIKLRINSIESKLNSLKILQNRPLQPPNQVFESPIQTKRVEIQNKLQLRKNGQNSDQKIYSPEADGTTKKATTKFAKLKPIKHSNV